MGAKSLSNRTFVLVVALAPAAPRRPRSSPGPINVHVADVDAPIHAAMRADELMETGDMDGRAVWLRIVKAIEELVSKERPEDAEAH